MILTRRRLTASILLLAVLLSIPSTPVVRGANVGSGGAPERPLTSSVDTRQGLESNRNAGVSGGQPPPQASSSSSTIVVSKFSGLSYGSAVSCGAGFTCTNRAAPPDVQVAVGPAQVVEMTNVIWGVWTKQGSQVKASDLATFWSTGADRIGDPRVLYDQVSGRWFASILDVTQDSVIVGVSASSDPTGSWHTYSFKASSGNCPDQPIIGVDDDKVVVSVNDFLPGSGGCNGNFVGLQYWVINKSQMLSGASTLDYQPVGPDSTLSSLHPVHSLSPTSTEYMVSSTSGSGLLLSDVTGVPPNAVITHQVLSIPAPNPAPDAPQLNAVTMIDTGDYRILDASWSHGMLWTSLEEQCTPSGDSAPRACVRLIEVNTNTSSVVQDWDVGKSGSYYFYPALRADSKGDLFVVFGYSSPSTYPSLAVAMQGFADPHNTLGDPTTLAAGSGSEVNATGYCPKYPVCRYGDYFGAALDPSDSSLVWVAGQFGAPGGWSTWIAGVRMSGSPVPLTFSYTALGGTPPSAPSLVFTSSGVRQSSQLMSSPTTYLLDYGTSWNVTDPVSVSTGGERWKSNQQTSGVASIGATAVFTFYHQFNVSFRFSVKGGGSGYSAPTVTSSSFGVESTVTVTNGSRWVDSGSGYSYQNPLAGSSTSERWEADSGTSGVLSSPGTVSPVFHNQFAFTVFYQVSGGGNPAVPTFSYLGFGSLHQAAMNTSPTRYWLDYGAQWNATNPLSLTPNGERWFSRSQANGTVQSVATLSITYQHQFFVDLLSGAGGSISPGSDWYDAGQVLSVTAEPSAGWALGSWKGSGAGSVNGNETNISITVNESLSEEATFLPGLTLTATDGGTIIASFGSSSRVIAAGTSTYYVPLETDVSLKAVPSSFLYQFNGWSGSSNSLTPQFVFRMATPVAYTAEFGLNYTNLGGLGGAFLFVLIAAYLILRRRR